jgi:large subunit ribosomal protein L21
VYAIIQSGGRQVKVTPGSTVLLDRVDAEPGSEITTDQILCLGRDGGDVAIGAPFVPGVKIVATVVGEARGPKIRIFKKKRRKGYRRTKGHRSTYTRVQVKEIVG